MSYASHTWNNSRSRFGQRFAPGIATALTATLIALEWTWPQQLTRPMLPDLPLEPWLEMVRPVPKKEPASRPPGERKPAKKEAGIILPGEVEPVVEKAMDLPVDETGAGSEGDVPHTGDGASGSHDPVDVPMPAFMLEMLPYSRPVNAIRQWV